MKNIILNEVNGKIADMDRAIRDGKHDRRFWKSEIFTLVWNSPQVKARLKQWLANQNQGWPDIDAYSAYVYNLIERVLRKQRVVEKGGRRQLLPVFASFQVPGQREHLYCRRTRLLPDELRASGRAYLELGVRNVAKGKIFLAIADEIESKGLRESTESLWDQITETSMVKGEI